MYITELLQGLGKGQLGGSALLGSGHCHSSDLGELLLQVCVDSHILACNVGLEGNGWKDACLQTASHIGRRSDRRGCAPGHSTSLWSKSKATSQSVPASSCKPHGLPSLIFRRVVSFGSSILLLQVAEVD